MSLRPFALALVLAAGAAVTVGCSGSAPAAAETPQEAFARGQREFERGRYDRAAEHFRAVLDFGRASGLADEAQLLLARSFFEDEQYLLAANEFTRFAELYPDDPRREDAEFHRIQAYVRLSPPYPLDQSDTERAIAYIRLFAAQYPASPRTGEVVALLDALIEKLARKDYEAARLYEQRELFAAAVMTYEGVLADYPTSPYADDALFGALRAQISYADASVRARQGERYGAALAIYDRLVQLFPSSPLLGEAQGLYDRAYAGRRDATPAATGQASRQ